MRQKRIELIENRGRNRRPLVDSPPILSSAGSDWAGLPLELMDTLDRGELRRFETPHALASICIGGRQQIEVRIGSTRHTGLMTPGRVSVGVGGQEISHCTWSGTQRLLVVELTDAALALTLGLATEDDEPYVIDERFGVADGPLAALGEAMRLEVQAGCPSGELYAQSLSLAFALQVRHRSVPEPHKSTRSPSELSARQLERVCDYIDTHLARPLKLMELAAVTGLGVAHFARLFKRTTGLAPYRHVLDCRVERAARLLGKDGESIAEIALATGFADQSHLTFAFRKATGLTPARFRRQVLAKRLTKSTDSGLAHESR